MPAWVEVSDLFGLSAALPLMFVVGGKSVVPEVPAQERGEAAAAPAPAAAKEACSSGHTRAERACPPHTRVHAVRVSARLCGVHTRTGRQRQPPAPGACKHAAGGCAFPAPGGHRGPGGSDLARAFSRGARQQPGLREGAARGAVPRAGATPPAPPSGTAGGWNAVAGPRPPAPRCARCGVRRRGRCARAADPARQPGRAPPSPPALPGGGCGSGAGEPGELRVTGAPRAVAEDGNGRGRGRECGVKVPVSRSRLPRGARARCRVSARSGLSLPRFETFRRRPSPRHAPATAALAVPGSGQAFASRRPDPFSGVCRPERGGERRGARREGSGQPSAGGEPGGCAAAPHSRLRLSRRQPPQSRPRPRAAPQAAPGAPGSAADRRLAHRWSAEGSSAP
ncbi:translation initiation factor IF-2-like [Falco naumanni]|uniref:translation initiation factor IF-2-like n=1 Tax=Falco naumanni TaxID=148594 RepID=UPI001ADDF976|nr:translation initiation factor IF-2-like [Falco naumanni]